MLKHNKVTLTGTVLHLLLEGGAEGVEGVSAGDDLLVGEETDPAQTGEETIALVVVGELSLGGDGPLQILLGGRGGTENLLGSLLP